MIGLTIDYSPSTALAMMLSPVRFQRYSNTPWSITVSPFWLVVRNSALFSSAIYIETVNSSPGITGLENLRFSGRPWSMKWVFVIGVAFLLGLLTGLIAPALTSQPQDPKICLSLSIPLKVATDSGLKVATDSIAKLPLPSERSDAGIY